MSSLSARAQEIRRFIPLPVLLAIGRRRVAGLMKNDAFRELQETNMRWLLENTDRAEEVPVLAREYAEFDVLRNYRRWHAKPLITQRVEGAQWLTTERDPDRGVVLSFMHHGQYDGLVGSLHGAGINVHGLVAPDAWDPDAPVQIRQHYKLCGMIPESPLVSTAEGSAKLAERLEKDHVILAIATDVAGRTPITFLGRQMLGSFGAVKLALQTNSPVTLVTSHENPDGSPFFRLHEPIEPKDFPDSQDLLNEILRRHEPAVLAWPAAYDSPHGRLAIPTQNA
jgi:lauroyl/myristoyl acyltransferase